MNVRLFAALLLSFATCASAAEPDCKLVRVAEWPIRLVGGRPVVEGAINGKTVNVLVHTAAYASLVTTATAKALDLHVRDADEVFADGKRVGVAQLDALRIGASAVKGMRVRVGIDHPGQGVDFILGNDFLGRYDVEYDYAGGFVRIFQPVRCVGASLAYWDPRAHEVGLERDEKVLLNVVVNGKRGRAQLDSSTLTSFLDLPFAETTGRTPGTAGVLPARCNTGAAKWWMSRFDTVEIGNQVTRDARVYIVESRRGRSDPADMYLGNDFLRAHRVLVSRSRGTMYFSHVGGQVFRAIPGVPCDERLKDKKREEVRAALDELIAENPRDALALIQRAAWRWRDEPKEGLADIDAVIALEPSNPVAYSIRAAVRELLNDYPGALADSDAALERGLVDAHMFGIRGRVRWAQGDVVRAMEEYEQAFRLDPGDATALRSRGRNLYHSGRFEDAEKDFAKLLTVRPGGVESIWLSLARQRRGLDARAVLEEGRAKLKDDQWPAPVLDYLLGRIDRAALMTRADHSDDKRRRSQQCEARYYVAARLLVEGKDSEARPLLGQAVAECPRNYIEYKAAAVDLGALR